MATIGVNWKDIWKPVWKAVWQQTLSITAVETDTGLSLSGLQLRVTGLATETDTALGLTPIQLKALGIATETDTALGLTPLQLQILGLATEIDTALALASGGTGSGALTDAQWNEIYLWLSELHKIHGLTSGVDLVVSATARTAGGTITQTVAEIAGVTTVVRVP